MPEPQPTNQEDLQELQMLRENNGNPVVK